MSDKVASAGQASYIERNELMINDSDYCVFYIDKNTKYEWGTKITLNYAKRKEKTIISLIEKIIS